MERLYKLRNLFHLEALSKITFSEEGGEGKQVLLEFA
jgi:hypothetical protein